MHSSDSLNSGEQRPSMGPKIDQQQYHHGQFGSSPRSSQMDFQSMPGQQVSSPILTRREVPNPPPQMPQPVPYQPQMLVDPNTGQHYILPHAQPQYFYPFVPAPMYYQPGVPPGYMVASQAQPIPAPPQSPTHARTTMFFRPQGGFNGGYFVEHPPSSNVSVCGQQDSEYFNKNLGSRHSLESGSSGKTPERKNSRDSMSPGIQTQSSVNQTSFAQLLKNDTSPPGKFSTTSSCTSGFGSGPGDSAAEGPFNNVFTNKKPAWMDIDLNAPVTPESESVEKKPPKVSGATAFTVTFDEESKPFSLQDAVKQAPKRFLRRSLPPKNLNIQTDSESEHQDPKHYLFNKMLQGPPPSSLGFSDRNQDFVNGNQEFDTLSEAGTYVVDTKSRMEESQILDSEHESSDETESTVSKSTISKPSTSARPPVDPEANQSRSLLAQRLEELRKRANVQIPLKSGIQVEKKEQPPSRICQRHNHTSSSTTSNNNFRRGDGGRFSMRAPSTPSAHSVSGLGRTGVKPPFKAGVSVTKKPLNQVPQVPQPPQKDTPEMAAWLRRKEYDPRKSAAEAKKIQQLKARETIFQQNRSISFHPGSSSGFSTTPREEHHKSHEDLTHIGEEEPQPNRELERQVDALTQKCLKSIQLIKICHQNTLSESVENLLDRVVLPEEQEVQEGEPISDQLKRLSSAFDAIQKYFEEQRSSSASPPMLRRLESTPGDNPSPRSKPVVPNTSPSGSRHIPPADTSFPPSH
ncbi:hypothetical protein FO519_006154 [Halicephalobus sp. NKZ332]|nr:hypothetical protein FO519_006154 [Halicephalobus sp. NKZ332]